MNARPEKQIEQPPFDACPRCGYALCGLPAEYACPECGLRYDASCGLYRARDPRRTLMMWLVTLVVPCVMLPLAFVISPAPSGLLSLKVLGLIVWLFALVYMGHNLVGDFRRGFGVAVTCEGLIVRLPGQNDGLIPWLDVQEAHVLERAFDRAKGAVVVFVGKRPDLELRGATNVFAHPADTWVFVDQVRTQIGRAKERKE